MQQRGVCAPTTEICKSQDLDPLACTICHSAWTQQLRAAREIQATFLSLAACSHLEEALTHSTVTALLPLTQAWLPVPMQA